MINVVRESLHLSVEEEITGLSNLLQKLDSLDSQELSKNEVRHSVTNEIVELITNINPTNTVLAGSLAAWLTQRLLQPLEFNKSESSRLMMWLGAAKEAEVGNAFYSIKALIKTQPQYGDCWEMFHPEHSKVLRCLGSTDGGVWNKEELVTGAVQCLDAVLDCFPETPQLTEAQTQFFDASADALIRLHYNVRPMFKDPTHMTLFQLNTLTVLGKVCAICPNYARSRTSELFGLGKAYMQYVCDLKATMPTPQKVYASQQTVYVDEGEEFFGHETGRSCGGKLSKTRKPRAVSRSTRQCDITTNIRLIAGEPANAPLGTNLDIRTSDSDGSEPEGTTGRSSHEQHCYAKIRLAGITLLGVVARALDRRILYGFWHALFSRDVDSLLIVGLHDPSSRCRSAALQVAAQILFGSKNFLNQAESKTQSNSSAFVSFSQNLGALVVSIYENLTEILSSEASLPVLTQALKCLAVLVQATPFHKFQNDILLRFVQYVRPMVHHRDYTIQVSALMVFEFLLSSSELIPEIANAVGSSPKSIKAVNGNRMTDEATALMNMEYFEDDLSDLDDSEQVGASITDKFSAKCQEPKTPGAKVGRSWLLLCVLQNLEGCDNQSGRIKKPTPTSVRIESLQVLSAMATHFSLLSAYLPQLALSLQNSLEPSLPIDVRLYAARCLDTCAYQMSCHLLDTTSEFAESEHFWSQVIPIIMRHIQCTCQHTPALKICLCDALSNIGVVVFERLPHATRMQLLSFLSGISGDAGDEEMTVRATAARALAVFVLFPSLRGNLVFVENTAELILGLVRDSNLLVRVKAQWSLGNISDALLASGNSVSARAGPAAVMAQERISDDLLRRLINAALEACNDNDKVRCNAVRALGNLLRILNSTHLENPFYRSDVQKSLVKLADCIRSGGSAKVKWNACYAISNLMHHHALFVATRKYQEDLNWQIPLYSALCHVIVHHSNFKVRINAATAIANIEERSYFGSHFETFWSALLAAIEQSERLDNFCEYNHRDQLQQQLCLAMCHIVKCALLDDFVMLKKYLTERLEVIHNTWLRVTNRMVPEKVAPLLSCSVLLQKRFKDDLQVSAEQKNTIAFIVQALTCQ